MASGVWSHLRKDCLTQGAREGGARQLAPHFFLPGRHQPAPRRALPQTHAPLGWGSPTHGHLAKAQAPSGIHGNGRKVKAGFNYRDEDLLRK